MKKSIFIIITIILLTISCSLFNTRDINKISDWVTIPKEGTEFIYSFSKNGVEYETKSTYIISVERKDKRIIVEYTYYTDEGIPMYLIYDDEEGVFVYSADDSVDISYDFINLKTPIEVGNEWEIYGNSSVIYEIIAIDSTRTVGAGIFNDCIVIECKVSSSKYWYSPSIGNYIYSERHSFDEFGNIMILTNELDEIK